MMNGPASDSESLVRLSDLAEPGPALAALEAIFFESSVRTEFAAADERRGFFERWTAYYLEHCRRDVWFWRDADGGIAGYLTGCRDSAAAAGIYAALPAYALFEDCFVEYPAHLHVNCFGTRRNVGIGARLIERFALECREAGLPGLHVVTGPGARNVGFYHRVGFTEHKVRAWQGRPLLFMGRSLRARAL
ncbi:MAG: N-acetyltransferase [Rhodospirillaceae bacterium]